MKTAILVDIHGSRQAMETVIAHLDTWQPDHVIVNGDTVNRGPCSLECWQKQLGNGRYSISAATW
jgi:predicted phosphodiesterase